MSGSVSLDVCNLDLIYNKSEGYEYSLPKSILETFLSGKAFDNTTPYSSEEALMLTQDINQIYQDIMALNPIKESLAVISAGSPGSGKTTVLRQELEKNAAQGRNYAYICPDDVCLKNQTNTYLTDIQAGDGSPASRLAAYNKWRPGSNAANHLILANLIRQKFAFYFGSTSSSPATAKFFDFLKSQNYRIRLIHVTASDDVRWNSIQQRDKTFIQTTESDVKEKGLLIHQRITDTFLKFADEIHFYYRNAVEQDAVLAAKWVREETSSEGKSIVQVLSPVDYDKIKLIHNSAVNALNRSDLRWEDTVERGL